MVKVRDVFVSDSLPKIKRCVLAFDAAHTKVLDSCGFLYFRVFYISFITVNGYLRRIYVCPESRELYNPTSK